jgi:RHS repeat-associated protein
MLSKFSYGIPGMYNPFGMVMPGREYSNGAYRFGFNGQEKDNELIDGANAYTADFWEYSPRTGRRYNLDPTFFEYVSPISTFLNNPILFTDPNGETVSYNKFKDHVNSTFLRIFNRSYRRRFRDWKRSPDSYTIKFNQNVATRLADAKAVHINNPSDDGDPICHYKVEYSHGFRLGDISNPTIRVTSYIIAAPFVIAGKAIASTIGIVSGLVVGVHNLFTNDKHDWGWGMAQRLYIPRKNGGDINIFGFGIGNYNKFNMFGQKLDDVKLSTTGLISIRIGQGKNYPVFFIDIFNETYSAKKRRYYYLHFNFASNRKRNIDLHRERIISLTR